jgi:hypothetical protein
MAITGVWFVTFNYPPGTSTSWYQHLHEIMRVEPAEYEAYAVLWIVPAALTVVIADWIHRKLVTYQISADVGAWIIVVSPIIAMRSITTTYADLHPEEASLLWNTSG